VPRHERVEGRKVVHPIFFEICFRLSVVTLLPPPVKLCICVLCICMYSNAKFCNDVRSNDTDIHANVKILHALIDALVTMFEIELTREQFHRIETTRYT